MKTITISDETYERLKDELEEEVFPRMGDEYYYYGFKGSVVRLIFQDDEIDRNLLRDGNCFKTEKEAEKYGGRIRSMKPKYLPQEGDAYFIIYINNYGFQTEEVTWCNSFFDEHAYLMGITFMTEEDAHEWIDEYSKYFEM